MSCYVFIGPTIGQAEAERYLEATYLPPARQGDVARLLAEKPTAIGIVDGYFEHVPSVWHKEILLALQRGVRVYGAASMGALRAAELQRFGMMGIGRIFEWFRDGTLEDDDEVAVVHGPEEQGFRELSEAMVNIRDALRQAQQAGVLQPATAEQLLAIAKSSFYRERTYPHMLAEATRRGLPAGELSELERFIGAPRESLKKRDAVAMLERMAEHARQHWRPARRPFVERTFFVEQLLQEIDMARVAEAGADRIEPQRPLAGGESLNVVRKKTLLRYLAVQHAAQLGLSATPEETQQMADDFRVAHGLVEPAEMEAWLRSAGLSLKRFSDAMRELATVRKLEARYRHEIDARVPDHVRLNSARDVNDEA